jgi:hypothetical protein
MCTEFWWRNLLESGHLENRKVHAKVGGSTRWRSWLKHCATSQKVACLIPDRVTAIFHRHNPSGSTMALGLNQPLTEMSTWGVKVGSSYGWQSYHLRVPIVLKSGSFNLLEPSGLVQDCNGIALYLLDGKVAVRGVLLWVWEIKNVASESCSIWEFVISGVEDTSVTPCSLVEVKVS